jgi:hypothetical protein
MRLIRRDGERVFVFSSTAERLAYLQELEEDERKRHADSIREIHEDYINEIRAENSYNSGTRKAINKIRIESILESELKEDPE